HLRVGIVCVPRAVVSGRHRPAARTHNNTTLYCSDPLLVKATAPDRGTPTAILLTFCPARPATIADPRAQMRGTGAGVTVDRWTPAPHFPRTSLRRSPPRRLWLPQTRYPTCL